MGYGLSGAIGAAFANKNKKIIHFEGDVGFTQILQEYGTVAINKLNIKTFLFCDDGSASIRMTQKTISMVHIWAVILRPSRIPNWDFFSNRGVFQQLN